MALTKLNKKIIIILNLKQNPVKTGYMKKDKVLADKIKQNMYTCKPKKRIFMESN